MVHICNAYFKIHCSVLCLECKKVIIVDSKMLLMYVQMSCKILHVSSGDEMSMKARELAHHFDTQGTPVMIGVFQCFILLILY